MTSGDLPRTQHIVVSAPALRHNLRLFRDVLPPGTLLAGVVKANAYGHGLEQVAPVIGPQVDWFAVHAASEARRLRRAGVRNPILVMGYVTPHDLHDLDPDVHVMVSAEEVLQALAGYRERTGIALPVHLKVETGTHRQGVGIGRLPDLARAAARAGLEVAGVATHFANIEDTLEHEFARTQLRVFEQATETAREVLGGLPPFVHAACSAAALLFPDTAFTLARVGISMYGHWPSRETQLSWTLQHGRDGVRLRPALTWKTEVGQLKPVERGGTVSYGRTWTALRPTMLAVLPVGYSDGYSRVLGNRSRVLVRGVAAPVVGRVCMNIILADVTDVPGVAVGDEVVLIGRQGEGEVPAEELADLSGTINYEILARLSTEIPRTVADE